ncbi:MAG: DNA-binding protein, partial [Thermodesulfobacteriota bacterium]|nr:DNA-binding protein [Thermodesulfobacteriota bacterium]
MTVISGFHSPMERESLTMLLRGAQPIIICPARSINKMRINKEYKKPLKDGRLLFLSPFDENQLRISAKRSYYRNLFVA